MLLSGDITARQTPEIVEPVTIEDWESGTIGPEWTVLAGAPSIVSTDPIEGSYHLQGSGGYDRLYSYPGDGLPYYPTRGDAFSYLGRTIGTGQDNHMIAGLYFGVVDSDNSYFTRYFDGTGTIELLRKVDGTDRVIDSTPVTLPTASSTISRWEVRWDDGSHGGAAGDMRLDVYNHETDTLLGTVETGSTAVEDATGQDGDGIGFWIQTSYTIELDYLQRIPW